MINVSENVVSGEFTKEMRKLGLENIMKHNHNMNLPPTHHRTSKPISAIYATGNLEIVKTGILPELSLRESMITSLMKSRLKHMILQVQFWTVFYNMVFLKRFLPLLLQLLSMSLLHFGTLLALKSTVSG